MNNKFMIWLYFIVVSVLMVLNVMHWRHVCSIIITIISSVVVLLFSLYINSSTVYFQETDNYRVFYPKIQTVVAVVVIETNLIYYSNTIRLTNSIERSVYDYMSYCAIFIIGLSLFVAVRMKTLLIVQFFHVILIPICFFVVMSLPVKIYINISLAIIGAYSLFQLMMTDKHLFAKIKKSFNKYR